MPILERMQKPAHTLEALKSLQTLIATKIEDSHRRDDANIAIERMRGQASNGKVSKGHIGIILELLCLEESARLDDLIEDLSSVSALLYEWDADSAETIMKFFGAFSDATLEWGSTPDIWRAVMAPNQEGNLLERAAVAAGKLTPNRLKKLLERADSGQVFSPEEAEALSSWWDQFRTTLRLAVRREKRGFYLCTGSSAAQLAVLAYEEDEDEDEAGDEDDD